MQILNSYYHGQIQISAAMEEAADIRAVMAHLQECLVLYVRDEKIMSLENAVQKMTSLAAEHVGIANRGIIASGYFADLVLFDSATVKDNATIQNPYCIIGWHFKSLGKW